MTLETIAYADNGDTMRLIEETPSGLFAMLQEEGMLPKGSDASLLAKYHDTLAKNPCFIKADPRVRQRGFIIQHYAGPVVYEIAGFIERNKGAVHVDIMDLLESSSDEATSDFFRRIRAQQMAAKMAPLTPGNSSDDVMRSPKTVF